MLGSSYIFIYNLKFVRLVQYVCCVSLVVWQQRFKKKNVKSGLHPIAFSSNAIGKELVMWCRCCKEVQMHVRIEEVLENVSLEEREEIYFCIWWELDCFQFNRIDGNACLLLDAESNKAEKAIILVQKCQMLSELFYVIYFFYLFLSPPLFPLPLTILGWRLRSLEWALSNFYPWSFTASHDPWANGIAPSLISLCIFAVLYFQ